MDTIVLLALGLVAFRTPGSSCHREYRAIFGSILTQFRCPLNYLKLFGSASRTIALAKKSTSSNELQ